MMAKSWRYLVIGAVAVAVLTVAPWATKRVQACGGIGLFSINCDGIIIANQIVQIGHLVHANSEKWRISFGQWMAC